MRWRSLRVRSKEPPPARAMVDAADVAYRALCARRALRLWMEDRSLEGEEFLALWKPFKGSVLHLFVLFALNATALARLDDIMFYVHDALEDAYLNNHFEDGPLRQMIVFSEVDTVERLWGFTDFLLDSMEVDDPEDPPGVTPENLLVGRVRLRQVRVRPGPCVAGGWPEVAADYDTCHGFFDAASADTLPFGPGGGDAWTYREAPDGDWTNGYLGAYPPHGYWTDLPRDVAEAKTAVGALKNSSWVDLASRAVIINLLTYNANVNLLCLTMVIFELPPGGGAVPRLEIQCTALMQYATHYDMQRLSYESLFLVCTFALTVYETVFLFKNFRNMAALEERYLSFWALARSLMMAACWAVLWLGLRRHHEATVLLYSLERDGLASTHRAEPLLFYEKATQRCLASATFIAWFMTFHRNRVTTQVLVTLRRSKSDLLSYCIMYVVLHCAFALAGYYLFGDHESSFKTFSDSALAILAIALGEMRSDPILTAHPNFGALFFILFIFIVVFVFHNMFFVILSYNYDSARDERRQLDRGLRFKSFFYNGYLNAMKWLGRPVQVDPQEVMEMRLIRCGFSPGALLAFRALLKPKPDIEKPPSHPDCASVSDLKEVEDIVKAMEADLIQAKSELTSLVSSLSSELNGM